MTTFNVQKNLPTNWEERDDWQELLTGQFLLFGLLGKLLHDNPQQETLQPLVDEEIFADAPFAADQPDVTKGLALLQAWSRAVREDPEEEIGAVRSDYTRLFVGAARLPIAPYESVYYSEDRTVFQQSTLDVRHWYKRYGLEAANLRREPDDHIGLELLFIAHLARLGAIAASDGEQQELRRAQDAQLGFCRKHLNRWAPTWCELMLEHARTDYYRGLTLLVRGALAETMELLQSASR